MRISGDQRSQGRLNSWWPAGLSLQRLSSGGPSRLSLCCLPSPPQSLSDLVSTQVVQLWPGEPSVCM